MVSDAEFALNSGIKLGLDPNHQGIKIAPSWNIQQDDMAEDIHLHVYVCVCVLRMIT